MKKTKKNCDEMTQAELREATRVFNAEMPVGPDGLPGRPMNPSERRTWKKVRKKMGRPKIGKGVKRVMISMEKQLLQDSDDFARKHHLSRSQIISAGLRKLMADSGSLSIRRSA
jgi:hypothetical protein